jgi:hypothetical protein
VATIAEAGRASLTHQRVGCGTATSGTWRLPLNNWPVSDSQFATEVVFGLIFIVLIVSVLRKAWVTRKEFAGLQLDVRRLSDDVKELRAAEQRRFLNELKGSKADENLPSIALEPSVSASPPPSSLQVVK